MDETQKVDHYVSRADALTATRLLDGKFSPGFQINFQQNQPLQVVVNDPDESDLKAFLMDFRHFILQGEPVFIGHIHGICFRKCSEGELRRVMGETYRTWKNSRKEGPVKFVLNEETMEPARLLDLWIHGLYFHTDERKFQELQRLIAQGAPFTRHLFLDYLMTTTSYIVALRNQIRLGRAEGVLHV